MRVPACALAIATLGSLALGGLDTPSAEVQAVLAKPLQRMETADFRATGHLVRVEANGARTSYPLTLAAHWFPGVLRILCKFEGQAQIHLLLELRANGQSGIQIAHRGDKAPSVLPFDQWSSGPFGSDTGSGFSYEDFLEPQFLWLGQSVIPDTKFGARNCDLLTSIPRPTDRTHYIKIKSWLDHVIGYPVYVEKTFKGNGNIPAGTTKEFTYFGLRQTGGVWSASQVEEKTRGLSGSTLLIVERGSSKANLDLKDFSPEQLTRF